MLRFVGWTRGWGRRRDTSIAPAVLFYNRAAFKLNAKRVEQEKYLQPLYQCYAHAMYIAVSSVTVESSGLPTHQIATFPFRRRHVELASSPPSSASSARRRRQQSERRQQRTAADSRTADRPNGSDDDQIGADPLIFMSALQSDRAVAHARLGRASDDFRQISLALNSELHYVGFAALTYRTDACLRRANEYFTVR